MVEDRRRCWCVHMCSASANSGHCVLGSIRAECCAQAYGPGWVLTHTHIPVRGTRYMHKYVSRSLSACVCSGMCNGGQAFQ